MSDVLNPLDRDFDFNNADFYLYGRQSDKKSFGNASTKMQTEDLLADVAQYFKIDPKTHPYLRQFHEVHSAVDGRVRYNYRSDGSATVVGLRPELGIILQEARTRTAYAPEARPQIICVSILNRLGRSEQTVAQLYEAAVATGGRLYVWSVKDGSKLLNPLDQGDMMQLTFAILFAGKRESEDKSKFVRAAKASIMKSTGRRVLGRIPLGYESFLAKDNGATPPEPVTPDWNGKVVTIMRVNPNEAKIVRDIFERFRSGWNISKIVRYLNLTYPEGNPKATPKKKGAKALWTRGAVRSILENPIYIGRRVYNLTSQIGVATHQYRRTHKHEWVTSPYEPELRILDDELFETVQAMIDQASYKRTPGRPMNREYLLHRTRRLRCGICGGLMSTERNRHGKEFTYYYTCVNRAHSAGQHKCQTVLADEVDHVVRQALRHHFSELKEYALQLETDIKNATSATKRREVEQRLEALKQVYEQNQRDLLNPEFRNAMPERVLAQFVQKMEEQLEEIENLSSRLARWGATEDVRYKQQQVTMISGMLAFDRTSTLAQRGVIEELFEAIYLWPRTLVPSGEPSTSARLHSDAVIWLQWKGEDHSRAPLPIGFASDWPVLDYEALGKTIDTLMERAELSPRDVAGDNALSPTPITMAASTVVRRKTPVAAIRAYVNARYLYLDMTTLKRDVRERIAAEVAKRGQQAIWKERRISTRTVQKILGEHDRPLIRHSWLKAAEAFGIDLEPYRVLPDDIYHPEGLEQVAYWATGVAYPEYWQWVSTLSPQYDMGTKATPRAHFEQNVVINPNEELAA